MKTMEKPKNIAQYQEAFEKALRASLQNLGCEGELFKSTSYALLNGGKRVRPMIVQAVADALSPNQNVMEAALSVEFFHTASLIADDLPCMDNDDFRRDQLSLHKAFEENVALLTSYGLICAAFEKIEEASVDTPLIHTIALKEAAKAAGFKGATSGQYKDLYADRVSFEEIETIYYQKTIVLFEIAFLFGWIFGGGKLNEIERVKKVAYHFGFAFQLVDDLDDQEEGSLNIVSVVGYEKTKALLKEHLECYFSLLKELNIASETLEYLGHRLSF